MEKSPEILELELINWFKVEEQILQSVVLVRVKSAYNQKLKETFQWSFIS
jgi:hypothetical protein